MSSERLDVPLELPKDQKEGTQSSQSCVTVDCPEIVCPATHDATGTAEQVDEEAGICQFFLKGKCRFGHKCRLSHSLVLNDTETTMPDQEGIDDDDEKVGKHKRKKGKVNKSTKEKESERNGPEKKPRMRTADEVISRILWDSSVEASEFVVGYVDRFLGVLERPFAEFNWDAEPCDCNYTTELALPRHRILYFTHRGQRVWDRHSRIDRVFGSTGHTLAPPFGVGEEVEGVNMQDAQQQDSDLCGSAEEQPPVCEPAGEVLKESICAEKKHLDEDQQGNTNSHTPESTHQAPVDEGSSPQRKQEMGRKTKAVVENVSNGSQTLTDQMSQVQLDGGTEEERDLDEGQEEWTANWEAEDEESRDCLKSHKEPCLSQPLEQREEKCGGRPPKRRPTHFISFRANTPSILSTFQRLQEELTSALPSSAPHWKAPPSLHVTMCLLVLHSPSEVATAGEILRRFAALDRNPPVVLSFPVKLKHFSGKVLYLSPQPQLQLQQLNSGLQEAYRKEGWLHRDSFNPRYHLTLAKVEDKEGERVFEGVGDLKVGKGLNFGRLPVNTLHLCAMGTTTVDGFYDTLCTVTLR